METKTEYPVHLLIQLNTLAREAIAKNDLEILTKAVRLAETIFGFDLDGFESFGAIEDTATVLIRLVREYSGWKVGAEDLPEDTHERRLEREERRMLEREADRRVRAQCPHCCSGGRGPTCHSCEERFVVALKSAAKRYVEIVRNEQDGIETHAVSTYCDVVVLALEEASVWGGSLPSDRAADVGLANGMAAWDEICKQYSDPSDEREDAETQTWLDELDTKAWRHMRDIAKLVIDAIEMEEDLSFSTLCRLVAAGLKGWSDGDHVSLGMGEPPQNDGADFLAWSDRYRAKREKVVVECIEAAIADAARNWATF